MAQSVERSCTMLVHFDKPASASELKEALEGNDPVAKDSGTQSLAMVVILDNIFSTSMTGWQPIALCRICIYTARTEQFLLRPHEELP